MIAALEWRAPSLKPQIAQARMTCRPGAGRRPMELALVGGDRSFVDRGDAPAHQAALVEFPVLVAVGSEPVARIVVPFVGKAHGDAGGAAGPQFLDQPVVQFLGPFAAEERLDRLAALQELLAVAPDAVRRIGE